MCTDMELFINLIFLTDYMNNLFFTGNPDNVEKNKDILFALDDWHKYKNVQEIIDLNNKHINNAIKEVLKNERCIKIIKERTNIDIIYKDYFDMEVQE